MYEQQKDLPRETESPLYHEYCVYACRAGGKTYLSAFYAVYLISTRTKPLSIVVVAGSQSQAEKLIKYCRLLLLEIPEFREGIRKRWDPSKRRIPWEDGSEIIAVTGGSEKSLRSAHGSVVIYDECALISEENLEISRGILTASSQE